MWGSYIEEPGVQFCPHCGASLDVAVTEKAEEPQPTVPPLTPTPSTLQKNPSCMVSSMNVLWLIL